MKAPKLIKADRNKDTVKNSYIDAMVVELVPTGVESLGVVVEHLFKANRADVRVLQVLGQRNAREQNKNIMNQNQLKTS